MSDSSTNPVAPAFAAALLARPAKNERGQDRDEAPKRPTSADEIIAKMGEDFAAMVKKDRRNAWRNLVDSFMINLPLIVKSRLTQPLRDVISIAMEIDKHILGGSAQGSASEPLDSISERWTNGDDDGDSRTNQE